MHRFRELSQKISHFQYHVVWVPKDRYRVSKAAIGNEVESRVARTSAGGISADRMPYQADALGFFPQRQEKSFADVIYRNCQRPSSSATRTNQLWG